MKPRLRIFTKGPKPVFVNISAIEKRHPNDATWTAFTQFVETFFYPLLLNKYFSIPLDTVFATYPKGVKAEEIYLMSGNLRKLHPVFFVLVCVPTWLSRRFQPVLDKKLVSHPRRAKFLVGRLFGLLERQLQKLKPRN